jgi:hypothetical protein
VDQLLIFLKGKTMSATITWVIEWMNTTPTTATPPETVITAGWRCNGTQAANGTTYAGTAYGSCSFTYTSGEPFTPYDQLTQNQVLGWCWADGVDKAATEAAVQQQIDNQINPPVIQPPLPWAPAPVTA